MNSGIIVLHACTVRDCAYFKVGEISVTKIYYIFALAQIHTKIRISLPGQKMDIGHRDEQTSVSGTSQSVDNLPISTSTAASTSENAKAVSSNSILVNPRQRGNPVLKFIRSVPWEYSEIVPDYVLGANICSLFLSVRYHNLHPDYIHERLKELRHSFELRILLVQVDVSDPYPNLKTLTHISMLADLTIIPVYSAEEAGRILENYKIYENKPPDMIQERQDPNSMQQVVDALTSIRSVNKTDASTLLNIFGSLAKILKANVEQIALCPGFGPQKAQKVHSVLHEKFKMSGEKNA